MLCLRYGMITSYGLGPVPLKLIAAGLRAECVFSFVEMQRNINCNFPVQARERNYFFMEDHFSLQHGVGLCIFIVVLASTHLMQSLQPQKVEPEGIAMSSWPSQPQQSPVPVLEGT